MDDPGEHSSNNIKNDAAAEEQSWKSKLSAAFNDEQVFFSLLLLGVYYIGYTIAKARFDADSASLAEDERFIQSCYCSTHQRSFFRSWFIIFCVIWLMIHSYVFVAQVFAKTCPNLGHIIIGILTIGSVCLDRVLSIFICICKLCKKAEPTNSQNQLLKIPEIPKTELENILRLLWFQYCKLYVAGYAKDDKKVKIMINNEEPQNKDQTDTVKEHCCFLQYTSQEDDCVCCKRHVTCPIICSEQPYSSSHILKGIIRFFLILIKYVSQLVTVPLLFLQIFDTYSLLCFSPDLYCSRTSEYKLHLAQTAITLLFYCSLALSQLASTMLAWNPWPQMNKHPKEP